VTGLSRFSKRPTSSPVFELILSDVHMPGMDGFALIESIRQRFPSAPSTIVMLSSARYHDDAERCRALGVAGYLLKPVRQSELYETLARVLGKQHSADVGDSHLSSY
jgi:two-component system, sensor histidine kinase and response regulator